MEETKKKVLLGDTGNRAEVFEEDKSTKSVDAVHAKELLNRAGTLHKPLGAKYLGYAIVHYYETENALMPSQKTYFVACHTDVAKVNEGHADIGWKQLKSALMKSYGRDDPKTRN
jgi:hypothetical protein